MKYLLSLAVALFPILSFAQEATIAAEGIDQKIDKVFRPIADWLGGWIFYPISVGESQVPVVLFVLIGGALFFTLYLSNLVYGVEFGAVMASKTHLI